MTSLAAALPGHRLMAWGGGTPDNAGTLISVPASAAEVLIDWHRRTTTNDGLRRIEYLVI